MKEFYAALGGDYETAIRCFHTEERLYQYLNKLLQEPNFNKLFRAVEQGNTQESFEAAHALKGVVGMFYLGNLFDAVSALTEQLRLHAVSVDMEEFRRVKQEYCVLLTLPAPQDRSA